MKHIREVGKLWMPIVEASADNDYPRRVQMSAKRLGDLALARFAASPKLYSACQRLHQNSETTPINMVKKSFSSDDAKVLGFFIGPNSKISTIRYDSSIDLNDLPWRDRHFPP